MPGPPPKPRDLGWAGHVLLGIDAPLTRTNYWAMQWWHDSEGTPDDWHNWMATTLNCCGGVNVNSAGVKKYPDVAHGVAATVRTLRLGYYTHIVAAFHAGNSLTAIWKAINASPWCKGCQSGQYPVVIYNHLGGGAPDIPGTGSGGGGAHRPSGAPPWDWSAKVDHAGHAGISSHPKVMDAARAISHIRR